MVLENHKKLKFHKSLEIGKEKEEFVKNIFKDYYDSITDNDNYEYDLRFDKNGRSLFVEVKYDYLMSKTGNMAIECSSRDKKSGIYTTKSDYWIQVDSNDKIYIIDTNILRLLCKDKKLIQTKCEDSWNKIFLIDKWDYTNQAITIKEFLTII